MCGTADLEPDCAARFDVAGTRIAVVRIGEGGWHAVGDRCTHQDISLGEGEVHPDTLEIECWKHGSCFSLETGQPGSLPATKAVPVYDVRIDGDDVLVDLS